MKEVELQSAVIDLAHVYGWKVMHTRAVETRDGRWLTPIQGDPGFPDLVMVSSSAVLFVELKSVKGRVTVEQKQWLDALLDAGAAAAVWRPVDWTGGVIEQVLKELR